MSDLPDDREAVGPNHQAESTGTVAAPDTVLNVDGQPAEPSPSTVYPSADEAGFGPLEDPPRVEGVELIGRDPDDPGPPALESADSASTPPEEQVGFVLPVELMQRADQIGQETAVIAAQVLEIEKVNDEAEAAMAAAASADSDGDTKES